MGAFLEKLLEPATSTTAVQYADMLLSAYPLFPEIILDRLSHTDPYMRLRFEMKRRGITNKNLAENSGVHETAIARAFSRKTGLDKHWDKIARVVGVDRRWLVDGVDDTVQSVSAWPSPMLGRLGADLTMVLNQEPPFMTVGVAGFVEIEQDLPQFRFKKGDHLILARTTPGPKDMAIVRRKDGSAIFGLVMEQKNDHPSAAPVTDVVLNDGEGRVVVVKGGEVAEQFLVRGVLFKEPTTPVRITHPGVVALLA
jgi:hypothetical protein